jgi:ribosomal protein S6--L-glutamate ligase
MHVTLLSRGLSVHTTRRLSEACGALGHTALVVDPAELQMGLVRGGPRLFLNERPYGPTDVVIPRFAPSMTAYGLALVTQFTLSGVPVLNDAVAIANARNKMRLMQLLARQGIRIPPTIIGRGAMGLKRMVDVVGGFPVAIKLVQTEEKFGIIICESAQSMEAVAETVLSMGHDLIVQRYIDPAKGRDVRALVLGRRVIAAVRRRPTAGKLRHSLSTGAQVTKVRLTRTQEAMALESARVVGLQFAAVDMLGLKSGDSQVYDVHSSPGLRELEEAVGEDLAVPIIDHAVGLAAVKKALPRSTGRRSAARASARNVIPDSV